MPKNYFFIFIIFAMCSLAGFQKYENPDFPVNSSQKNSDNKHNKTIDSISYCEKFISQNNNNALKEQTECLEKLAKYYISKQQYQKSLKSLNKAVAIYKQLNQQEDYWAAMKQIGFIYYEMGNYTKALDNYLEILKYYEDAEMWEKVAGMNNNIGILFHRQNNPKKALEYYHQANAILKQQKNTQSDIYARLQTNMGLSYYALRNYEKAKECYQNSLKVNEKLKNQHIYTVNIGNLASVYSSLKEYGKAENYLKEAIEKNGEINNQVSVAINRGDLGILYLNMAEEETSAEKRKSLIEKTIYNLETTIKILKKSNDPRRFQAYMQELSHAYELKGDFRKSLEIYKEHILYKDSVFNDENNKELSKREIGYEFEKREDSIRMANEKEMAVKDATLTANKKQKWLFIAGLFLLSVIGGLLFYQNSVRKKNNEKLVLFNKELNQANQVKARFFSILNHDLRSPVSNIIKFIRLQQNSAIQLDEDTKERLEKQTVKSAENLLMSMEDLLLWSKGQMENFKPQFKKTELEDIFEDIKIFFEEVSNVEITFENSEKLDLQTDENYLKTVMRNLTSNAVKALTDIENPKIIWKGFRLSEKTILSITDNGSGATNEEFQALYDEKHITGIKTGLGLHLVRDMAKAINCDIETDSQIGKGTTIKLIFTP